MVLEEIVGFAEFAESIDPIVFSAAFLAACVAAWRAKNAESLDFRQVKRGFYALLVFSLFVFLAVSLPLSFYVLFADAAAAAGKLAEAAQALDLLGAIASLAGLIAVPSAAAFFLLSAKEQ